MTDDKPADEPVTIEVSRASKSFWVMATLYSIWIAFLAYLAFFI